MRLQNEWKREAISSFQFFSSGVVFSILTFFLPTPCGCTPPLPSPASSLLPREQFQEQGTHCSSSLHNPVLWSTIARKSGSQLKGSYNYDLLPNYSSSDDFLKNIIGYCIETCKIPSVKLLCRRLNSTLICSCYLAETSDRFCFTAIVNNLSMKDVWKIRQLDVLLPLPWSWFVPSSFAHFSSLQTLAMQTSLFINCYICRKLYFKGSKYHGRATRSEMEGEERKAKWHLS